MDCWLSPMFIFFQAGTSCQWTTDSQRLILEYFDMIHDFPSHIYYYALKFSPSWIHQYYSAELPQEVKVVRGLSDRWGACFRTVVLNESLLVLAYWKDTIAVGSKSEDIVTLNAITGSKIVVLSGHTDWVQSLTFFPDGTSLVSGGNDRTIKLWDMQTGGVVKTFQGHTDCVCSVSVSPNCTTIVSMSEYNEICLWDIQAGECHCIIQQESCRKSFSNSVQFFPLDPQHFISVAGGKVQGWNIDGHKIIPEYDSSCATLSFDCTKLVSFNGRVVQVQSPNSGVVMAKFHMDIGGIGHCCISPDGRLVAVSSDPSIYVWDITNSEPCLVETFTVYTDNIMSLAFSSSTSLISANYWGKSVKFWLIGASPTSQDVTDSKSAPHASPVRSITLQAKDGIAISHDSDGVVKIWNLSTGLCKESFQSPARPYMGDVQLIDNRLILVWHTVNGIYIWDVGEEKLIQRVDYPPSSTVVDLRISGDGSKVFCLNTLGEICAWYIWTGNVMDKVRTHSLPSLENCLTTDGPRVWVHLSGGIEGWDCGAPDSSSIEDYRKPPNRPHLDFIGGIRRKRSVLPGIEDTVTGKVIFQPPLRYATPNDVQWDGQYLVAGYESGEVLILDCNCTLAH